MASALQLGAEDQAHVIHIVDLDLDLLDLALDLAQLLSMEEEKIFTQIAVKLMFLLPRLKSKQFKLQPQLQIQLGGLQWYQSHQTS